MKKWGIAVGLVVLASTAHAQFPRKGVDNIPNGVAAPFVGRWSIDFPEGDGMINGKPVVDCQRPVELKAVGQSGLIYRSSEGKEISFELSAFEGRTTWMPEQGASILAVWTEADAFFSYTVDPMTGRAGWNDPRVFRRCR